MKYVPVALMWLATYAPEIVGGCFRTGQDLFLFVMTTVGVPSLAFYQVDIARGGRHFFVQPNVERVIGP